MKKNLADPDNQPHWEGLGFLVWVMLNFEMTEAMDNEVERLCKEKHKQIRSVKFLEF